MNPISHYSVDKAIAICRAAEETKKQSEELQAQLPFSNINQAHHRRPRGKQNERKQRENQRNECKYCGSQHDKGRSPLLENYAKNAITLLKYVGPNKQRELKISIRKANAIQVRKTPMDSLLIL